MGRRGSKRLYRCKNAYSRFSSGKYIVKFPRKNSTIYPFSGSDGKFYQSMEKSWLVFGVGETTTVMGSFSLSKPKSLNMILASWLTDLRARGSTSNNQDSR